MFTPLKSILKHALERKPIRDGVRVAVVLEAAREAVETVFPNRLVSLLEPTAIRNGTITLTVRSPMISQDIKIYGAAFLKKINERVGTNIVQRIRIRLDTTRPV